MTDEAWSRLKAAASHEITGIAAAMAEHAANADADQLGQLAHKLKGIALSFSAPRLAGLAGFAGELARLRRLAGLKAQVEVIGGCAADTLEALRAAGGGQRGDAP